MQEIVTLATSPWNDSNGNGVADVSYSFSPDGVRLDGKNPNTLFATMNASFGSPSSWQPLFTEALTRWATASAGRVEFIYLGETGFHNFGANGQAQNDPRFGDIRIGAHRMPGPTLAHAYYPPPNGGTAAGDAHFDNMETWTYGPNGSGPISSGGGNRGGGGSLTQGNGRGNGDNLELPSGDAAVTATTATNPALELRVAGPVVGASFVLRPETFHAANNIPPATPLPAVTSATNGLCDLPAWVARNEVSPTAEALRGAAAAAAPTAQPQTTAPTFEFVALAASVATLGTPASSPLQSDASTWSAAPLLDAYGAGDVLDLGTLLTLAVVLAGGLQWDNRAIENERRPLPLLA